MEQKPQALAEKGRPTDAMSGIEFARLKEPEPVSSLWE